MFLFKSLFPKIFNPNPPKPFLLDFILLIVLYFLFFLLKESCFQKETTKTSKKINEEVELEKEVFYQILEEITKANRKENSEMMKILFENLKYILNSITK